MSLVVAIVLGAVLLVVGYFAYKSSDTSYLLGVYKPIDMSDKKMLKNLKKIKMKLLIEQNDKGELLSQITSTKFTRPKARILNPWSVYLFKSPIENVERISNMQIYIKRVADNQVQISTVKKGKITTVTFEKEVESSK